jgi:carbamoyl-phosphate synthase large subunit
MRLDDPVYIVQDLGAGGHATMSNILITGAGGAAAVALLKHLRGGTHDLIAADMSPYAAGLYLVPSQRRLLIPSASAPDYVAQLVAICREHRVQLLIPTVDAELIPIARALLRFTEIGTRVLVAPPSALALCLDKFALMRAVGAIAAVPRTELFTDLAAHGQWWPRRCASRHRP